ncbi:MAG: hypothetical protein AAGD35_06365 [Actinomycetota bacterium]
MRFVPVILALLLVASGCANPFATDDEATGSDTDAAAEGDGQVDADMADDEATATDDDTTVDGEPTDEMASADEAEVASDFYPPGMTQADLPEDRDARSELMGEWLTFNMAASSGYGISTLDDQTNVVFSLDIADQNEAAGKCDMLKGLAAAYLHDAATLTVEIEGWVLGDDGNYASVDWDNIVCA